MIRVEKKMVETKQEESSKRGGETERRSGREEGRERVKSILIPLIHTSAVLPTGIFTFTH